MLKRQHKIVIIKYLSGKLWLAIIPILHRLFNLKVGAGFWNIKTILDIFVITLLIGSAILKWYFTTFELNKKEIIVTSGLLISRKYSVDYEQIAAVKFFLTLPFKVFGAVEMSVFTEACKGKKRGFVSKCSLVVSETDYLQICYYLTNENSCKKVDYKVSVRKVAAFSMLSSTRIFAAALVGTIIVYGEKIVGEKFKIKFSTSLDSTVEAIEKLQEAAIPLAAAVTIIILTGWLLSAVINFFRYMNFEIVRQNKDFFVIKGGLFKWKYYVKNSSINYVDFQQNMLTKMIGVVSVYVRCTGYGKGRGEQSVIVPFAAPKCAKAAVKELLPNITKSNNFINAKHFYIGVPLSASAAVFVGATLIIHYFPEWSNAANFFGAMLGGVLLYCTAVKIAAHFSTGIGVNGVALTLKYSSGTRFHTVIVPVARVAYIKIRRTIFQRAGGNCDVVVYTKGAGTRAHRVRGVDVKDAAFLMKNYDKMRCFSQFKD